MVKYDNNGVPREDDGQYSFEFPEDEGEASSSKKAFIIALLAILIVSGLLFAL